MTEPPTTRRWRQFGLRSLLLLIAICGLLFWWLRPEELDRRYFPMAVGDVWIYESDAGDVSFEVTGTQRIREADCFVVKRTIGDHASTFYCSVSGDGIRIHQVDDDRYDPPFRQFAFPAARGAKWQWKGQIGSEDSRYDCTNAGLEPVQVPLGEFRAFRVHQQGGSVVGADFWLAKGVGVVQLSGKHSDEHDPASQPQYFQWRLKEYRRAR